MAALVGTPGVCLLHARSNPSENGTSLI